MAQICQPNAKPIAASLAVGPTVRRALAARAIAVHARALGPRVVAPWACANQPKHGQTQYALYFA